jgi:hypothetical protein
MEGFAMVLVLAGLLGTPGLDSPAAPSPLPLTAPSTPFQTPPPGLTSPVPPLPSALVAPSAAGSAPRKPIRGALRRIRQKVHSLFHPNNESRLPTSVSNHLP